MMTRRLVFSFLLILLFAARSAFAQSSISGKVLDPQGNPVGNIEVLLHAVEEKSGNEIDKDTTRVDGTFTVSVKTIDPNAVYFVAVVWKDNLYIGDLMRAPFPTGQDYIVQVGVNPVDLSPAAAGTQVTPEEQKHDRKAGIIVVAIAALLIALVTAFALRRRPPARRRWLLELARLEDEMDGQSDVAPALKKRRAELRARLRALPSG